MTDYSELFDYNPDTGVLTWKNGKCAGSPAGTIHDTGNGRKYIRVHVNGRRQYAHRIIVEMFTKEPLPADTEVDHRDGNGLNNRFDNFRITDRVGNASNSRMGPRNTSGVVGVCWDQRSLKWLVRIGKRYVGRFAKLPDAVRARKDAEWAAGYSPDHGTRPPSERVA